VELVEARGLKFAYQRVGHGPPLVLVHGAAADSRMWEPQLAGLAEEFSVVAWDEPGAGRSSELPESYGLAEFADGLAALLKALGLGPAHVLGWHRGARVLPPPSWAVGPDGVGHRVVLNDGRDCSTI
jgi:pimeloyl-ACP methyl ester carboxylesterase